MIHICFNGNHKNINPILESEIRKLGGEKTNKTNLKCYMTSHECHKLSKSFKNFSDYVLSIIKDNLKCKLNLCMTNIWGAIYKKGEYAISHDHSGDRCVFSFVYFVNVTKECSPLIFQNIEKPWEDNDTIIIPENGKLVIFDPKLQHYVPPQNVDHERVIIAGNIDSELSPQKITYQ